MVLVEIGLCQMHLREIERDAIKVNLGKTGALWADIAECPDPGIAQGSLGQHQKIAGCCAGTTAEAIGVGLLQTRQNAAEGCGLHDVNDIGLRGEDGVCD